MATTSSAETPSKRARTTSSKDPYELVYWPDIPGRGEFIRLAFAATQTPFVDVTNETKEGVQAILSLIDTNAPDAAGSLNVPPLAPPILRHGDLILSQVPAILSYLGPRLGLVPSSDEDPEGAARVLSLALTVLDGLSNEPHEVHHPVAVGLVYEDQREEAKRRAKDYRENRLPKFLGYFERVLKSKSSKGGKWLYGGEMSYADLVLWQGLDGVSFAFPTAMKGLRESGDYEGVWRLYERVKDCEGVREYLDSKRRLGYSNGIWRHYPELDE